VPDPLEQLRTTDDPIAPRDTFRLSLRRRLFDALGVDPVDLPVDLGTRSRTMSSTTTASTTTTGIHALTAYLAVHDAGAAIDFYAAAFGAVEDFRVVSDDGRIGHAELQMGDVRLQLSDEYHEVGADSPRTLGGTPVALSIYVDDCDAVWEQALAAGARGDRAPEDQPHGNRMAVLVDPFGHRWFLLQPIEQFDLTTYAQRSEGTGFEVVGAAQREQIVDRSSLDGIWPALSYVDAPAAIRFAIDVLGFTERIVVTTPDDASVIAHSELQWPEGGIVQFATAHRDGNVYSEKAGAGSLYIITRDPDAVLSRCQAAGATIVDPMREVDYGGRVDRMFTVADQEGNFWCFGTYGAQ
jgi:PhnB protein